MYVLCVNDKVNNSINDILGIFDNYELALENKNKVIDKLEKGLELYIVHYDLNVLEDYDIEPFIVGGF